MKKLACLLVGALAVSCNSGGGGEGGGGQGGSDSASGGESSNGEGGQAGVGEGGDGGSVTAKGGSGGGTSKGGSGSGGAKGGNASGGTTASGGSGVGGTPSSGGSGGTAPAGDCAMADFTAVIRDFTDKHPDFEPMGAPAGVLIRDAVKPELDADGKPVWALPGAFVDSVTNVTIVTSKDTFAQWFRDTAGVNQSIEYKLPLTAAANGAQTIGAVDMRPIDGKLLGNADVSKSVVVGDEGKNQLWTLELIAEFEYQDNGKELMIVSSDDDSWVFINNKLAIDNGGLHGPDSTGSISLQTDAAEFGLVKGQRYKIHFFMADRHLTAGTFQVRALGMKFTNCKAILPKR